MSIFKKNKYKVVKGLISKEEAERCHKYFLLKRNAVRHLKETGLVPAYDKILGEWADLQIPNTYSIYSDHLMETYLQELKPKFEKHMGMKLHENYSYARVYKKGDILHRHKDRYSCEMSSTVHLGGDEWSIFLEPSGKEGLKGKEIKLKQGDALIYMGCEVEHWREAFEGDVCTQVFLHYTDASKPEALKNKYDSRPMLGIPKC